MQKKMQKASASITVLGISDRRKCSLKVEGTTIFPISEQKSKLKINGRISVHCRGARTAF